MNLRAIAAEDLARVAEIHQFAFPDSYLSKINHQAIIKYYAWHMRPPNICYAIGAYQEERLLGFCFAGTFRNAEFYFILENWFFFLKYFLTHPSAFFRLKIMGRLMRVGSYLKEYAMKKFRNRGKKQSALPKRFGVLSIAVNPARQGSGVGKALMKAVEHFAKQEGYAKLILSVHPENEQAVAFYEKNGWLKSGFKDGQDWQGHMEKNLAV